MLTLVELAHDRADLTDDGREIEGVMVRLHYGDVVVSEAVDPAATYQLGSERERERH